MAAGEIDVSLPSIPVAQMTLKERYAGVDLLRIAPFVGFHVLAVVCLFVFPPTWKGVALCVGLYYARMFGIAGGFHRYFSHRAYSTSRWFHSRSASAVIPEDRSISDIACFPRVGIIALMLSLPSCA